MAAQVLRADGGAHVGYQALVYPAVDATMSSPSVAQHAQAPILTRSDMDLFLAHYLGDADDALAPIDPLVSPLHAPDLGGLPPALVQTADLDPLRDEGTAYAEALQAARRRGATHELPSRPARLHELPGSHPGRRGRPRRARPVGRPPRATRNGRLVCERTRVS